MRFVSELYDKYPGQDIYVVGTGPSVRVVPTEFLKNRITIGCNQAWKVAPLRYGITIHPDLNVPEYMPQPQSRPDVTWVLGRRKAENLLTPEQLEDALQRCFMFEYHGRPNTQPPHEPSDAGRLLEWAREPSGDNLYLWSSIAQAAVNLAANMGAKNVFLIGCDNCSIGGNHHAHAQHTRWKGADPDHRYNQYYEGLAEMRPILRERGVTLLSMSPFMTLGDPQRDFARLCRELRVAEYIQNEDVACDTPVPLQGSLARFSRTIRRAITVVGSKRR